jgi:hypothetical protein
MKHVKIGLYALASIIGVSGVFAFTQKPHTAGGTIYYGYLNSIDNKVHWTLNEPIDLFCQPGRTLACTITSTTAQSTVLNTVDAFPAQHTVLNSSSGNIYQ